MSLTGYAHPEYAAALAEYGIPRPLPLSAGWVLVREIAGAGRCDAMGGYPFFACTNWSALEADLDALPAELVSLTIVTDPLGDFEPASLRRAFRDRLVPFKEHFVVDLERRGDAYVSAHHRRYARRAARVVEVERCGRPVDHLDEWAALYDVLVGRHGIRGIAAFSRASFGRQLRVPGIAMFRASQSGAAVGMTLWYEMGDAAYYHLGAYTPAGYDVRASFAMFAEVIAHYRGRLRWLVLGAGAGVRSDGRDGLTRFKRGWATGTSTVYLGGRIFDRAAYATLTAVGGPSAGDYFPGYRAGEFVAVESGERW